MNTSAGLCSCGCGGTTKLATRTSTRNGWVKGEPLPYLRGHASWKDHGPRWIEGPTPLGRPDLGPCWIWQRALSPAGYAIGGFVKYGARQGSVLAGRALFEIHVGPIPDDLELDHLCFTPACVRWEAPGFPMGHFEVVTSAENLRRRRTQKLNDPQLAYALVLRGRGMRWRAIATELGVTHPPLINRLKKYCEVNGLEYPASESTRPKL